MSDLVNERVHIQKTLKEKLMKLTFEEDLINNGFFHVLPEFEIQISRFETTSRPKNKLMSLRFSWLLWSIWLEFN